MVLQAIARVYNDATSFKTVERLSVQVIYFGYRAWIHSEPALTVNYMRLQ
jgi:hypothetical protein